MACLTTCSRGLGSHALFVHAFEKIYKILIPLQGRTSQKIFAHAPAAKNRPRLFLEHLAKVTLINPGPPVSLASEAGSRSRHPLSATNEEDPPQSSASVNSTPRREVEAAETMTKPLLSATPPGEQQSEQNSEQRSEDNDGGGGGLSWIAELAGSVGVLPAGEKSAAPAQNGDTDKKPDDANGLGWIAEVVSHVEAGPGTPQGSSSPSLPPKGGPSTTLSAAGTAGNVSPSPNPNGGGLGTTGFTAPTPVVVGIVPSTRPGASSPPPTTTPMSPITPIAGGGGGGGGSDGQTTPKTTRPKPPQPQTPSHLTWKPITDGTAGRPWGAPPPDEDQVKTAEGNSENKQEMASSPRLSRNLRAPDSSSADADHASRSQPRARQDPVAVAGGGGKGTTADDQPPRATPPSFSDGSNRPESEGGTRLPLGETDPAHGAVATGAGELRLETGGNIKTQRPDSSEDKTGGGMADVRDPQDPHETAPGGGDTESSAEAKNQCPGGQPKTLPPLQESVSAAGPGDSSAGRSGTRWDTLRSSVQRR